MYSPRGGRCGGPPGWPGVESVGKAPTLCSFFRLKTEGGKVKREAEADEGGAGPSSYLKSTHKRNYESICFQIH